MAPSAASARAIDLPTPLLAPVISATWPAHAPALAAGIARPIDCIVESRRGVLTHCHYVTVGYASGSTRLDGTLVGVTASEPKIAVAKSAMHQIGKVAERVGLSLRTVRYYEEMELICPDERTEGGFRLYTEANIERLMLIKQMKPLGFSVQEMGELLDARDALRTLDPKDSRRQKAVEEIAHFAAYAEERCLKRRKQLDAGIELAQQLSRESQQGGTVSSIG